MPLWLCRIRSCLAIWKIKAGATAAKSKTSTFSPMIRAASMPSRPSCRIFPRRPTGARASLL
ncbi:hypothetical protein pneo_cds_1036 [Pandoravirus neocaledonia]|uniref:Uncharacterized protein n=1 Tax=Pandoravirus neocaledonia TaxID=2107708 RepID=A0A2U7UDY0_9VIRU|nr:hypothetical protein pneo_cds_1036 [Pandoravirus neocaledonia]AVK76643.1 hypothetical protein pneo_cds_1036 [Pandoravirus neocaledonia]